MSSNTISVVVAAAVAGVVGLVAGKRPRPATCPPVEGEGREPPSPAPPDGEDRNAELDKLALACLRLIDVSSDEVLVEEMWRFLGDAGYGPLDPTGQPFDAHMHHAVDPQPTEDAALHNVVAWSERPGLEGHGRLLRPPDVVVYQRARRGVETA